MAEGPQLNSLDRFRKHPGRLVLEQYSHCEVPAGCGGVVLRWRNPQAALPLTLNLYTPDGSGLGCFLDGVESPGGRGELAPGRHLLAISLCDIDLSAGLVMFAATHDPKERQHVLPTEAVEAPLKILSQDDGTWKFTLDEPAGDDWKSLAFDDRAWPALVKFPTPRRDHDNYQARVCSELGAVCLGLPNPPRDEGQALPVRWWQRLLGRRSAPEGALPSGSV